MKKILSIALAIVMLFTICIPVYARAEPCDSCENGVLRPHYREGDWEGGGVCPAVSWQIHQVKYSYDDYICDKCGSYEYSVRRSPIDYRCTAGVCDL